MTLTILHYRGICCLYLMSDAGSMFGNTSVMLHYLQLYGKKLFVIKNLSMREAL